MVIYWSHNGSMESVNNITDKGEIAEKCTLIIDLVDGTPSVQCIMYYMQ